MSTDLHSSTMRDVLKAAGPILLQRQEHPTGKLSQEQRDAVQEATLLVVRELRAGRSLDELLSVMHDQGWKPEVGQGFIKLISQLLSKMYLQRMYIFSAVSIFTSMIASIAIPQAAAGEFPWVAAGLSLAFALVSVGITLWNWRCYRKFRQS